MIELSILVVIILVGISLIHHSRKKDRKKIFGIYSQPGKWFYLKYMFILSILSLRRLNYYLNREEFDKKMKDKDTVQMLSNDKLVSRIAKIY